MLDWNLIISATGAILGSGGILAVYVAFKKLPHDNRRTDAQTDRAFADATVILLNPLNQRIECQEKEMKAMKINHRQEMEDLQASCDDDLVGMDKRIKELIKCRDAHEVKLREMEEKIKMLQDRNNRLVNGINILVGQLRLTGQRPMWEPNKDDCETLL